MRCLLFLVLGAAACNNGDVAVQQAAGPLVPAAEFRILAPSDEGAANEAQPLVRWTGVQGADRYDVTVARDGGPAGLLDARVVTGDSLRVATPLADGAEVGVDVRVLDAAGATLATDSHRFKVVLVPESFPTIELQANDPDRAQGGYTLFNLTTFGVQQIPAIVLVNAAGEIVWFYVHPSGTGGLSDVRVLENGNLLGIYHTIRLGDGSLWDCHAYEMTWAGQVLWESRDDVIVHHEVGLGPGGDYVYLTYVGAEFDGLDYEGDGIEIVDRDTNEVVWEWNIFDHVTPRDIMTRTDPGFSGLGIDWSHGNAVVWDEARSLFWVCIRHFDQILGVDYPSGEIRITLGQDGLGGDDAVSHAHAPEVQPDGQILFYDNGNSRAVPETRVVQVDFDEATGRYEETFVWKDDPPFYTFAVGDADRLPNGNTLVTAGTEARLVEITADGDTVWDLRLVTGDFWIYRAEHVPEERIAPGVLPFR